MCFIYFKANLFSKKNIDNFLQKGIIECINIKI